MGKLDELRRTAGANVTESASKRDTATAPVTSTLAGLSPARMAGVARSKNAMEIPLDRIEPDPEQPREDFDEEALGRLAESLKTRGQLQPVRVRWEEGRGAYVLICGERRWRAARMAGLPSLSCVVSEGALDAGELLALQLIENCVREDLQPIEQARAYRALMDRSGWSGNRLAQELGVAQSSVVHALALLELPEPVQERVEQGTLSPSTAYEISKVDDPEAQRDLAERVVNEKLSRAETVEAVKAVASKSKGRGVAKGKSKTARLPAEMKHRGPNGCKVTIMTAARHTMSDVITDLEAVLGRLRAETEERSQDAA